MRCRCRRQASLRQASCGVATPPSTLVPRSTYLVRIADVHDTSTSACTSTVVVYSSIINHESCLFSTLLNIIEQRPSVLVSCQCPSRKKVLWLTETPRIEYPEFSSGVTYFSGVPTNFIDTRAGKRQGESVRRMLRRDSKNAFFRKPGKTFYLRSFLIFLMQTASNARTF